MSELAAFQDAFAEALIAAQPIGRIARDPGFTVYRNTSMRGGAEALRAIYPTADALIGPEMFTAIAVDFCRRYPPRDPVLTRFGAGFASYLRRQEWHHEIPYLADVARLDRLWLETFCSEDRVELAQRTSAQAGPRAGAALRLHPSTRFIWVDTPAMSIWLAHRNDGEIDALEPEWVSEGAVFVRRCGRVSGQIIDRLSHRLLVAIAAGASVKDVGGLAQASSADPAAILQQLVCCGAIHFN